MHTPSEKTCFSQWCSLVFCSGYTVYTLTHPSQNNTFYNNNHLGATPHKHHPDLVADAAL